MPNVFSSPIAAGDRVYFTGREGTTIVLKTGPTYEVLATNTLDDDFDASPALADNVMYLRGRKHLYALAPRSGAKPTLPIVKLRAPPAHVFSSV